MLRLRLGCTESKMYARASGGLPGHRHSAPGVLLCWDLPTLDPRCRVGPLSGATTLCLERQPQRILCFQPQAHGGAAGRRWATPGVCLKMEPPSRPQLLQNQLKIIQLHDPTRREHDFFTLASLSMRDGTQLAKYRNTAREGTAPEHLQPLRRPGRNEVWSTNRLSIVPQEHP